MNLTLILSLSIFLGVLINFFIVYIYFLIKENKRLKNDLKQLKEVCQVTGNDIYNIASRTTTGNLSHHRGNIQNIANLIKQIGEN